MNRSHGNQCIEGLHFFSSCGGGDYWCKNKYIHALTIWKSFGATSAATSSLPTLTFSSFGVVAPTFIAIVLVVILINFLESIAAAAYHISQFMGTTFLDPN
jgi:hypothetical protein